MYEEYGWQSSTETRNKSKCYLYKHANDIRNGCIILNQTTKNRAHVKTYTQAQVLTLLQTQHQSKQKARQRQELKQKQSQIKTPTIHKQ